MKLTKNQEKVLNYLKQKGKGNWRSPTDIGLAVGGRTKAGFQRHSSWASPICKRLVKLGLVQRNIHGWYTIKK